MGKGPEPLSFIQQAELFESRGMIVKNTNYATRIIKQLGYYRIKEAARPLSKEINGEISYENVSFENVISRYYQDKNLRVYLLHCIEEIEISVKTNIAYILGENGPFNYLTFSNWCNREEYCKYYLADKQSAFIWKLKKELSNSDNKELLDSKNLNGKGLPSIWLTVDILTFGEIVYLVDLMSQKNLKKLADYYKCTPKEFVSWIKCLKLIRNICAHNSNIIDVQLTTMPIINVQWKNMLFHQTNSKNEIDKYTNRIALVICILRRMMVSVNPDYNYGKIYSPISKIATTEGLAHQLGFANLKSINALFPKKTKKHKK